MEGSRPSDGIGGMTDAASFSSGKGHRDENFPVASHLIHARYRPAILGFYRFARTADDVADHAHIDANRKLQILADMQSTLLGDADSCPDSRNLRSILEQHRLSKQHALDLLEAFRRDATKLRYVDWSELMDYCRYSAMPVGRFVLDVHGESKSVWPASDALCAALQVINHLQDCGKDYRALNRVYIPLDAIAAANLQVEVLGEERAPGALRNLIRSLAQRTVLLLVDAQPFGAQIRDFRLALEVSVIQRIAENLVHRLMRRDPLSERVHLSSPEALGLGLVAGASFLLRRSRGRNARMKLASQR